MGHQIQYQDYPENINRKSVQAEWDHYAAMECWQENGSGLYNDIRWIKSVICNTYEEAYEYIEQHDKGWYDQLAVRYKVPKRVTPTKTLKTLKERADRLRARKIELEMTDHYANIKAKLVTCRTCNSKISTEILSRRQKGNLSWRNHNMCPVCGNDLRPESTLERIQQAKKNSEKADKEYNAARKAAEKKAKTAEIRWLVKVEFHV